MAGILAGVRYYHVIFVLCSIGLFEGILVGFAFYYPLLNFTIEKVKALKPGHEMRRYYEKLPIPLDFRVYFFNISNPEDVGMGAIPEVKEIGPYCYDAFKEKINIVDNIENDTLTYTPYETYFFNSDRSGNLTQDDYVTILNPLVVGLVNAVATRPGGLKVVKTVLTEWYGDKIDIYLTVKVRDILFDGIPVNCTSKKFAVTAVCSQIKDQPVVEEIAKDIYAFAVFKTRNGTLPTRFTVYRGAKVGRDIGRVLAIDDKTALDIWPDFGHCNEFHGTDGWVFPSGLSKEEGIWVVSSDLCRSILAKFVQNTKFNQIDVREYHADLGDMSTNKEDKCFCPERDKCMPKGVMDMTRCLKVPIFFTLPHFLNADPSLLETVQGLEPDVDKHIVKLYIESVTGSPVVGKRRIQFNLELESNNKIAIMANLTKTLHPIMWIEEGVELRGKLLSRVTTVFMLLKMSMGFRYLFLLGALEGVAYGGYKIYKERQNRKIVSISASKNGVEEKLATNGLPAVDH